MGEKAPAIFGQEAAAAAMEPKAVLPTRPSRPSGIQPLLQRTTGGVGKKNRVRSEGWVGGGLQCVVVT